MSSDQTTTKDPDILNGNPFIIQSPTSTTPETLVINSFNECCLDTVSGVIDKEEYPELTLQAVWAYKSFVNPAFGTVDTTDPNNPWSVELVPGFEWASEGLNQTVYVHGYFTSTSGLPESHIKSQMFIANAGPAHCEGTVDFIPQPILSGRLPGESFLRTFPRTLQVQIEGAPDQVEPLLDASLLRCSSIYLIWDEQLSTPESPVWRNVDQVSVTTVWLLRVIQGTAVLSLQIADASTVTAPIYFMNYHWDATQESMFGGNLYARDNSRNPLQLRVAPV